MKYKTARPFTRGLCVLGGGEGERELSSSLELAGFNASVSLADDISGPWRPHALPALYHALNLWLFGGSGARREAQL